MDNTTIAENATSTMEMTTTASSFLNDSTTTGNYSLMTDDGNTWSSNSSSVSLAETTTDTLSTTTTEATTELTTTISDVLTSTMKQITTTMTAESSKLTPTKDALQGDPTTTDSMKEFYRDPLIAVSIIACLLFLLLLVILVCWCKKRGKTIYQTVNITPKKSTNGARAQKPDPEAEPASKLVTDENGKSTDEVRLEMKEGVENPTYDES